MFSYYKEDNDTAIEMEMIYETKAGKERKIQIIQKFHLLRKAYR